MENNERILSSLLPASYKQRNLLLITLSIVFGFVIYNIVGKKTILLIHENKILKNQLYDVEHAGATFNQFRKQQNNLSKIIKASINDSSITQEKILEIIDKNKQLFDLRLLEFPKPETYIKNNYSVKVYKIVLQGTYFDLIRTIYALERKEKPGHIISISFNKTTDYNRKTDYLTSTIYLQTMKSNEKI